MKKKTILIIAVFVLVAVMAFVSDLQAGKESVEEELKRGQVGSGTKEVEVTLDADRVLENYNYTVVVEEQKPKKEEALNYLKSAEDEIDQSIFGQGNANHTEADLNLQAEYVDGKVSAEWNFTPYGYLDQEGKIINDAIPEEGILITADSDLSCGDYREKYSFTFCLYPKEKSPAEKLLAKIDQSIGEQGETSTDTIVLPEEIDGVKLNWKGRKQKYGWKILVFEIVIGLLMILSEREKRKKEQKDQIRQMELDYPEIVSRLSVFLGSGMTTKQAWNRISARYIDEREKHKSPKRQGFEAVVRANYEILDGESERIAFQHFGEEASASDYFRLSRILIRNIQKGNRGISALLEQESRDAFEKRKRMAKKLGEEADTKMLFPLILMLCIVLIIVMAPAIMSFYS